MSTFVTVTSQYHKRTAFMLCLFGGFFGLHYFYVGRIGKGILCLFGFGVLFWIPDMLTIALGKFKDRYGEYLKEA